MGGVFSVAEVLASRSSALLVPTRKLSVSPVKGSAAPFADGVESMRSSLTGCCSIVSSTDVGVSVNKGAISSDPTIPMLGRDGVRMSLLVWGFDSKGFVVSSNPDTPPNNSPDSTMTPHLITVFITLSYSRGIF